MDNEVVELNELTEKALKELRDFDENEAYFLLCEIFAHAQATKNYAQFQFDLNEWKKRYPVHLFSENYKSKIKYMLSNEFLDTVLKNFIAFDELSKKDPSKGLEKLKKVLFKAEKHKDGKRLEKELDTLYAEYPLSYLKEKYPHIVSQLLSTSNIKRILEKFDSSDAFKELDAIVSKPDNFDDANMFKEAIEEWQKLYPLDDFNDDYKKQVEKLLDENLNEKKLEEVFSSLDLSSGLVIPIELQENLGNIDVLTKNALYDLFKIIDKDKSDINSFFSWTCDYGKYINSFDTNSKNAIIENLMGCFGSELPPIGSNFKIPKMDTMEKELLSLSDFENMDNIKKETIIQFLGIISSGSELTSEDKYRLGLVNANSKKAKVIEKAKISEKLDVFMDIVPEEKLTPSDDLYLNPPQNDEIEISTPEDEDIKISNDNIEIKSEDDNTLTTNTIIDNNAEDDSFKETLKVEGIEMQKVESSSSSSDTSSGSTGGGVSNSLGLEEAEVIEPKDDEFEDEDGKDEKKEEENFVIAPIIIETILDKEVALEDNSSPSKDEPTLDKGTPNSENIAEEVIINEPTEKAEHIDEKIISEAVKEPKPIDDIIISQPVKEPEPIDVKIINEPTKEPEPIDEPIKELEPIDDIIISQPMEKQSSEAEVKPKKSFFERLFRNDDDDGRDF